MAVGFIVIEHFFKLPKEEKWFKNSQDHTLNQMHLGRR